ncbi:unnamed protein product [marine sediment metagenome]|uniref:Uncharacterized protein n=1 Tax=marine sediment metagenome TaxID=412755 RepID=X0XZP4_9ZZZZ
MTECPQCEIWLAEDAKGQYCPRCGWRPTAQTISQIIRALDINLPREAKPKFSLIKFWHGFCIREEKKREDGKETRYKYI